jgi:rare lipoprotein A (peptidoglycan hydrolase)
MTAALHVVLAVAFGAALLAPADALAVNTMGTTATYYDPSLHGSVMANGQVYDRWDPAIAASNWYPIGTLLRVTHQVSGRHIYVRVSDRGTDSLTLDLSEAAFGRLGGTRSGRIPVWVETVTATDGQQGIAQSLRKDGGLEALATTEADPPTLALDPFAPFSGAPPVSPEQGAGRIYTAAGPAAPASTGPPRFEDGR